jgi:hypothetical protein
VTTILRKPAGRLAALALAAVLTAGCGSNSTPADAAPGLAEQLARVDRAVATGEDQQIRERVEALVAATEAARDSGRLDDEQADRILAAAEALLRRLPAEEPPPEPSPSPSTSSPTTTPPSPDAEEEEEEEDEDDEDEDDPQEEKPEKPEKSDDSGPGKGKGKGHKDKED